MRSWNMKVVKFTAGILKCLDIKCTTAIRGYQIFIRNTSDNKAKKVKLL